jgi:hypothetical protein
MALAGNISEFPITDIIQLVDLSKQTGAVHIQGQRAGKTLDGRIYFRDGKIIGAELPGHSPIEAVYAFFTVTSGPFRFDDDVQLETPTITVSNEVIIMEGIMRQDAWAKHQKEAPALNLVPRLVPNPSSGSNEINLEAEEWRVLTMVNGKNTVGQIAQRSGLGEVRTGEIITQLLESGLIEQRDVQPGAALAPDFERVAAEFLGAGAHTLLQEAYKQAGIFDPAQADGAQMRAAVDFFEIGAIRLIGDQKARQAAQELRALTDTVIGA